MKDSIKIEGSCRVLVTDKEGKTIHDTGFKKNQITNAALAVFAGLVGNTGAQTAFTYLAVGTDNTAPAASQTALVAEIIDSGLARKAATVTRSTTTQTNDTLQLDATWTVSGTKTINEVGPFNASSVGVMAGRLLTGAVGVVSGNNFSITYKIKFSY